jgi:AhpD family alkylhydroperoxidase
MQLEQRDKELAAIGASIGCNCRPCAEHHIPAGREAGLSEVELDDAVATARAIRDQAIALLAPKIDQLLGAATDPAEAPAVSETPRAQALVSLGASFGANSHPLLERHIPAALDGELTAAEVAAALKVAAYVQKRASEMTGDKATRTFELRAAAASAAAGG